MVSLELVLDCIIDASFSLSHTQTHTLSPSHLYISLSLFLFLSHALSPSLFLPLSLYFAPLTLYGVTQRTVACDLLMDIEYVDILRHSRIS